MAISPSRWTISKRGDRYIINWENTKLSTEILLTELQYRRFVRESMTRLGIEEKE